ncbi:polysaccharide deacetylase family protein [Methylobacterium sp. WL9]|uniref:polysaccharide deacetylase family protein n=1 Tax=Methylobacterium sp. WL9 TaxID=2603898 RepID=UPI0011CC562E|nr:polysaccharide deacetylase family protein [Methylobacterium sp. WL9]TXN24649.1 polysaccharide deacetylase family protein [Methylobacterium sp. WL9]
MTEASHGRYRYSALPSRPVYDWPGGRRLAVYVALNLETFAFGDGLGAELAPGGPQPDVLNYSWRDWGNRVGVFRLLDLFAELSLPVAVLANSRLHADCPGLMEAVRRYGETHPVEIVAHGRSNAERQGDLDEAAERALIAEATQALAREEGRAPTGWLGPWISQSRVTPDLLSEAGYDYLLDWAHDDQPVRFATRDGRGILSVPYPQELNDIPAVIARGHTGREFARMIRDGFAEMRTASRAAPLVMGIALHPYIVGQPHRLRPLRRALAGIVKHRKTIWLTTPGAIARHVATLPEGILPG